MIMKDHVSHCNRLSGVFFSKCVKTEVREADMSFFIFIFFFKYILVTVPAGEDVVFDVVSNQFFKALHQNRGD